MTTPAKVVEQLVLVAGLSGAGKSTVLHHLEDLGFTWVDNLPLGLAVTFLNHFNIEGEHHRRIAIGLSFRDHNCLERFRSLRTELEMLCGKVDLIFLEANHDLLITRFRETRRRHHLANDSRTVDEAVHLEANQLVPLRDMADLRLDTTLTTVSQLKAKLDYLFKDVQTDEMIVFMRSFGFKYGVNTDPDMVLDARFLANPHYDPALRPLTGRDEEVIRFLQEKGDSRLFLDHLLQLFGYLLPNYRKEGKRYFTVDIGCTGGRHRSVYLVEQLAAALRQKGERVFIRHRDVDRVSPEKGTLPATNQGITSSRG
ncbi:MAG: RNase adapter RapZ [Magnetococcales bacterium]|nr:RNase adapter RapZ [Magnetococcales bacterium]NGZ26793.1 RNase adapter RapZ [Magnetococcales bacterium]